MRRSKTPPQLMRRGYQSEVIVHFVPPRGRCRFGRKNSSRTRNRRSCQACKHGQRRHGTNACQGCYLAPSRVRSSSAGRGAGRGAGAQGVGVMPLDKSHLFRDCRRELGEGRVGLLDLVWSASRCDRLWDALLDQATMTGVRNVWYHRGKT